MVILQAQFAMQAVSLLPEDRFINTFHVRSVGEPLAADLEAVADAIEQFYKPTAGSGFGPYISPWAAGVGSTLKIYNLGQPKPRAPVLERTLPAAAVEVAGGDWFPAEVAMCLSYQAAKLSGVAQARRRGRIFIGPLNTSAGVSVPGQDSRPSAAFQFAVRERAAQLWLDLAAASAEWVIYSPTIDAQGVGADAAAATIFSWSTDNAFDTQRRRGARATIRTVVPIVP